MARVFFLSEQMTSGRIYTYIYQQLLQLQNYKFICRQRLHIPLAANLYIALASSSLWLPQVLQVSGMFEKMDLQADRHHQTKIS
jgi:hypothetical protein